MKEREKHGNAVVSTTVSADSKCFLHNHVVDLVNVVEKAIKIRSFDFKTELIT